LTRSNGSYSESLKIKPIRTLYVKWIPPPPHLRFEGLNIREFPRISRLYGWYLERAFGDHAPIKWSGAGS
jgi:hypothetical protein